MKTVRVILSPEAELAYKLLALRARDFKIERTIFDAFNQKKEILKNNYHYGNPIAKNLIPIEYKSKYDVKNLFRIELPDFWRMLYTLTNNGSDTEIIVFILDIINHDIYNKKFGYHKR